MTPPREPTFEECTANAPIPCDHGTAFAAWYPRMGGYGGLCVVVSCGNAGNHEDPPCFDVWVWHDGEFPFGACNTITPDRQPIRLHHCDAEQFVDFGKLVLAKLGAGRE